MIAPLVIGLLFGVALQRAGLVRHERIVEVFTLRDLAVMKFLLGGIIAGAVTLEAARSLGFTATVPQVPTHILAQALGGGLFGVGMAVAGFCPGTIAAAAGTGRLDALFPGVAGLLAGAGLYHLVEPDLPCWLSTGSLGAVSVPELLGVSPWLVILLLIELAVLALHGK